MDSMDKRRRGVLEWLKKNQILLRIVKKWIEEIEKCNMGSRDANKERRIRRV